MSYKQEYKTKREQGFTIIEVLIVLAIAGLILLIVFLAVPALQRNSRNTQIKNDAAAVAAAITAYENNNNGGLPTAVTVAAGNVTVGAAGSVQEQAKVNPATSITFANPGPKTYPAGAGNTVWVYGQQDCNNVTNTRAAAIEYSVETSTSTFSAPTASTCVQD